MGPPVARSGAGFFGGVFQVLIPDNAAAIMAGADAVNPRFTAGWLDCAQHCGFATGCGAGVAAGRRNLLHMPACGTIFEALGQPVIMACRVRAVSR
jgi:hypothetical protein